MAQKTQQQKAPRLGNLKERIPVVDVKDLLAYHNPKDCKIPLNPEDLENCYVIKMAARYAEANKLIGVRYSHPKANNWSNDYEPHVVLLDIARVIVDKEHILVSRSSIGISNFAVLNPKGRKILAA